MERLTLVVSLSTRVTTILDSAFMAECRLLSGTPVPSVEYRHADVSPRTWIGCRLGLG